MSNTRYAYRDSIHNLLHRADVLQQDLVLLRQPAASRGHLTAVSRAEQLAEKLAIELAELQVTYATESLMGKVA